MERLTEKYREKYLADVYDNENDDGGLGHAIPLDDVKVELLIQKLGKYEDLEEQGLLPKCKPGDTVYEIHQLTGEITERKIRKITICNAPDLTIMYESGFHYLIVNEDFGKTVFLTQAEAEEALKRMERRNDNERMENYRGKRITANRKTFNCDG